MSEERRKVLEMLSQGKITVEEAEKLLTALSGQPNSLGDKNGKKYNGSMPPKYLRVQVEPDPNNSESERVNIRVPLKLIQAGLKLASFIPKSAQNKVNDALKEKGVDMDFSQIRSQDLEELLVHLNDFEVNVEGKEKVKIYCE